MKLLTNEYDIVVGELLEGRGPVAAAYHVEDTFANGGCALGCPKPEGIQRLYGKRGDEHLYEKKATGKVFLFNVPIITGIGAYHMRETSMMEFLGIWENAAEKVPAIGHEATAELLSIVLQEKIEVNRNPAVQEPGDVALVLKIKGRTMEGRVIDNVDTLIAIGFDLFIITRN